jgi:hypothetical protein
MSVHESLRSFERMSLGMKFVFFGAVFAGIFSFFPWFQFDELIAVEGSRLQRDPVMSSGFGYFPVFGMLSMIFAIATLFVFLRNETGGKNTLGFSNARVWMFLSGEAMFVLCIAFAVYAAQMTMDTTGQLKFGIFLTMIAHAFIFFGGFLLEKEDQKAQVHQAFAEYENHYSPRQPNYYGTQERTSHRPQPSRQSSEQLSFSDTEHERQQSILR